MGVGFGVGLGVVVICTHGVPAKQVSPSPHSVGAPDGHGRSHELTASFHDVPQKYPCCALATGATAMREAAATAA